MHVLIATPTAGGTTTIDYARTLVAATLAIHDAGGSYRHLIIDGAEVGLARNILAHAFLIEPSYDHVLFLDSDMAIDQAVFRHLLDANEPMIGAAYSERRLDLPRFAEEMARHGDEARARALASKFNVRISSGEKRIERHLCEVRGLGFGCVLIRRSVFENLIERGAAERLVSNKLRELEAEHEAYDFFGRLRLDTGEWLSEDYSFCERVVRLGDVRLLAYVGPGVEHVGPFRYSAPYIHRLREGLS